MYRLSISNLYLATEQCAKETGIPPQCISAFKGHIQELISHPHSCIFAAANAFLKIHREKGEKALKKLMASCLDNHGKMLFLESLNFSQHIL